MEKWEHGGDIYSNDIKLDFSANINPCGLPKSVYLSAVDALMHSERYPDISSRALRKAIAKKHNVKIENVVIGNGAADLIFRLFFALRPKNALACAPVFSEYLKAAQAACCKVKKHYLKEENDFNLGVEFLDEIKPETDIVILVNPNNPTGALINHELLLEIVKKCEKTGAVLILDECFLDFVEGEKSLCSYGFSNVFILKAFTKLYAMPGLRLGYAIIKNEKIIKNVCDCAQSWSVNNISQSAGLAALECHDYVKKSLDIIKKEKAFLLNALNELGFLTFKPNANYIFFKSAKEIFTPLLNKGILIRDCSNYEGLDGLCYRIAIKTNEDNTALINAIKQIQEG